MMHKGRLYRAAIPRYCSVDFPYSNGVPANFYLAGEFGYSGGFVGIPVHAFRSPSIAFDDATMTWQWVFTMVGNDGNTYGAVVADRLKSGSPGRVRNFLITDAFGNFAAITYNYVPDLVTSWEAHDITQNNASFATGGVFDPAFEWFCRTLPYGEE